MRLPSCSLAIVTLLLAAGCVNNSTTVKTTEPSSTDSILRTPVETRKPMTSYKPAFEGQTRVNAVTTNTPYQVDRINEKMGNPWAIIPLPDDRFLITDKSGFMSIYDTLGTLVKKITGLPAVDYTSQGGLLDVALDPNFSTNRIIYWSYAEKFGNGNLTAVAKGKLATDESKIENQVVIFRAKPELKSRLHFGSRLVFDKQGYLFVSSGERSSMEGREQAQWLNSGLGKIFRITTDGKPAPGNPFANQKDAMPEIYSYGHRNPQGLDFHPVTGELWEGEFGPQGGDELNIIKPGKNYGWPVISYGVEYSGSKIGEGIQQQDGMEQPVYYWDPVLSPSGMIFYTSDSIPEWKNNLFIGGLNSTHLARLVIEGNKVVGEERLLSDQNQRIRDVTTLKGKLYAVSDGGVLFRIGKK